MVHFYGLILKYFFAAVTSFFFIFYTSDSCARRAEYTPKTQSRAVLVYDVGAGKTLYAKNINSVYPIASITKLMMAVITLDAKLPAKRIITVKPADRDLLKKTGSRLTVGSTLNRTTMLHIALMSSENRAAAALSRFYPHGRHAFIRNMNRKAKKYRMLRTHFSDPTGLSPASVSTAHDLLLLVKHASQYPVIRRYSTDKRLKVFTGKGSLVYKSSNGLINNKQWKIELQKTGFTNEAGHCMVLKTTIKNRKYIFIILGARNHYGHYADAIKLKNWLLHKR